MPLVNTRDMFKKAYEGGYAIGAFNVNNMEIIQGIVEGAQAQNAPLILQVSKGARAYANHTYLVKLVEAAVETSGLPIALHLDHGPDFETCKSCIDGGFSSVMFDGSHLPFEENIEQTRRVVEYAHKYNVTVEAELGRLAGVEDDVKVSAADSSYTRPDEVEEFATATGCDSLAIAIGTSHGAYKFTAAVHPQRGRHPGAPAAALRHPGRSIQASARLPHRAARRVLRSAGIREDHQRKRRQDARRRRHPRGAAAQGRYHGCMQDQHRQRPAPGLHCQRAQAF